MEPTLKESVRGLKTDDAFDRAMTFVILEANHYIQSTNWKGENLSFNKFKSRSRATERMEDIITLKRGGNGLT